LYEDFDFLKSPSFHGKDDEFQELNFGFINFFLICVCVVHIAGEDKYSKNAF